MRILLAVVVFSLLVIPAFSQKQFEGTIKYIFPAKFGKDETSLTVSFGKNVIKLKLGKDGDDNEELMLVHIDSGKVYNMDMHNKTYRVDKLQEQAAPVLSSVTRKIAGYSTTPINAAGNTAISLLAAVFRSQHAILYEADSLFYSIPDKYSINIQLAFVHKGRIVLGAEIIPAMEMPDDPKDREKLIDSSTIFIEAVSVKWEAITEKDLSIPADFVEMKNDEFMIDSATTYAEPVVVDTVKVPQKKPTKASASPSKKPASPAKKTNSPQSGTIRKPE